MAGSKAKFIYLSDPDSNGVQTAKLLSLDESNTRILGILPATQAEIDLLPSKEVETVNLLERYINLRAVNSKGEGVTRRVIVPIPSNTFFLNGGVVQLPILVGGANSIVELGNFSITFAVGETRRFAAIDDSGLKDD